MRARELAKGAVALSCALALWLGARGLQSVALHDRQYWPAEESYKLLPSPAAARWMAAPIGREVAADILWAQALVYYGSSIKGDESFRYLERFIDNIIALDPEFKRVYEWAVFAVTYRTGRATQEEFRMAAHYFELAIERFPSDWKFFWHGGLLYWFDLWSEDEEQRNAYRERGAELIEQAMRKPGAPNSLGTQAAALYSMLGKKERALSVLQEKLMTTDDPDAQAYMLRKFGALAEDEGRSAELRYATQRFNALRLATLPNAPADLFVLVGPDPDPVIRWDDLATERHLFGVQSGETVQLFPQYPNAALPAPADDRDTTVP